VLPWGPPQGIVHAGEHLTRLRLGELMRPDRVSLRDMNLHTPATRLEASEGSGGERELYEYPGRYQAAGKGGPDKGGQQAKLRLEALQAAGRRGFGTSDSPRLVAGLGFTLAGHPRAGVDGEYRLVNVAHRGEQPQVLAEDTEESFHYSNDFECIASDVPYRAPRVTPRPIVRGLQTAIVVGPPGEEVHVDEHGRVKIQFHWDRRDALDETSVMLGAGGAALGGRRLGGDVHPASRA
jgi:type VI secretion system secreted protein VgrG